MTDYEETTIVKDLPSDIYQTDEKFTDHSAITADDSISLYLNEMDRVPLLTKEEEITLGKKMETGRLARKKMLDLGHDSNQMKLLSKQVEEGRAARDHLVKANIRLVVNIAKKYRRYSSSFLDLIQAGNVGLIRAVDKFDHTRGNRFSTYATWWIRRSVLRHLNQKERTIRIPNYLSTRIRKIYQVQKELTNSLERSPTYDEIGQYVDMSAKEVERLLGYAQQTLSLDQPVDEDGETDLQSYIENKNAPNPFVEVGQNLLTKEILDAMDVLDEREARILKLRFGIGGERKHTLKELGELFGITRERIRQIQKGALRKLRDPIIRQRLRGYL